jgi:hypothetical protein
MFLTVAPANNPDLPSEQYAAALAHSVRGLIGIAAPHATPERVYRWNRNAGKVTDPDEWLTLFGDVYDCLHASGLLRPAPLEEDEL